MAITHELTSERVTAYGIYADTVAKALKAAAKLVNSIEKEGKWAVFDVTSPYLVEDYYCMNVYVLRSRI